MKLSVKSGIAAVGLVAALAAQQFVAPSRARAADLGCHQLVAAVDALRSNLPFPEYFSDENPTKRRGEFDVNRYFEVFTHLKMKEGYTLDWVYDQEGAGGNPIIYARPVGQAPYANASAYFADSNHPYYLTIVVPEENPEGYFQYAVFPMLAGQFYQFWHAAYNDWRLLCGMDDVERTINAVGADGFGAPMIDAQKQKARAISHPEPSVALNDMTAVVTMLVFTKWGGFYRRVTTILRAEHSLQKPYDEQLVEYQCGVRY